MTELERALRHIKTRADSWAVKEVEKALSQEPCDDAISRDMALEKMADYVASGYADSAEDFEEYSRIICQLPPVTPQQKYGKWIVHEKPHGIRYLECPYCNTWYLNEHLIRNSYCPNCGAKMESEDKE